MEETVKKSTSYINEKMWSETKKFQFQRKRNLRAEVNGWVPMYLGKI